jgi:hypothetical protein
MLRSISWVWRLRMMLRICAVTRWGVDCDGSMRRLADVASGGCGNSPGRHRVMRCSSRMWERWASLVHRALTKASADIRKYCWALSSSGSITARL